MSVFTREAAGVKAGKCVHEELPVQQAALKNDLFRQFFGVNIWCRMSTLTLEISLCFRAILHGISDLGDLGEVIPVYSNMLF